MSVALVTVVWGEAYERYARELYRSVVLHFRPFGDDPEKAEPVHFFALPGRAGWPAATLYRYHVLLEHEREIVGDWIFLLDADMRFEDAVGGEVLSSGITAVYHPGYWMRGYADLPYERRPESTARVRPSEGVRYFAGGFVGGERAAFLELARAMVAAIDEDDRRGVVARWHDESHLNRLLADPGGGPSVRLSPSYCFPDDASTYPWLAGLERKLVALDKTAEERGER